MPSPKKTGINMELNVSVELAAIIGTKTGEKISMPQALRRLWAYLREHNLQDPEDKRFFTPDAKLEPVFGKERKKVLYMAAYLEEEHLTPDAK